MPFGHLFVISFAAMLCIIGLATWLATTRGNTIRDIVESGKLAQAEAIQVEISKVLTLRSNYPIAALYVIGGLVGLALPVYIWSTMPRSLQLVGDVRGLENHPEILDHYHVGLPLGRVNKEDRRLYIPVFYSAVEQEYKIEGDTPDYLAITLAVALEPWHNDFVITETDFAGSDDNPKRVYHAKVNLPAGEARLEQPITIMLVKNPQPAAEPPDNRTTPEHPAQDSAAFPDPPNP